MKTFEQLPLVLQLQHLSQKTDSDIEELLRRAKLVAMKLNLSDFENWCDLELMGYSNIKSDVLPKYRVTQGRLYVYNPYNGLIPLYIENDETYNSITTIYLSESVGEYVNLIKNAKKGLEIQLPKGTLDYLYKIQNASYGFALEPRLKMEVTQLMSVMTYVKNTIFKWSVNLEKNGILGEGMQFTSEEKGKAMSNNIYNIGNMQGVIGQVQDSMVTQTNQMIINRIDLSTLLNTLKSVGIKEIDLDELKLALVNDEEPTQKDKFGENVSAWYGKMISKAASGSWEIGVAVAANLLTQIINSYYGLS
ncbi:hypothetical protein Q5X76_06130 [Acinetobacter baumannii]|nr:hypothetical protein [Acinetobacter baumannii]